MEVFGKLKNKNKDIYLFNLLNIREWPCGTEPVKYLPEPVEIPPDRGFSILGLLFDFNLIIIIFFDFL